jgi:hypothetical protein
MAPEHGFGCGDEVNVILELDGGDGFIRLKPENAIGEKARIKTISEAKDGQRDKGEDGSVHVGVDSCGSWDEEDE